MYPWEYERGFGVGIARFVANWGRPDAPHYDRSRMEEDRKAQAAAALCEIAVARCVNEYAHLHVWPWSDRKRYRHLPDVGLDIEVRRTRTKPAICVRRSDAGKKVYGARVVDSEYRRIEVLGYISADDVIPVMGKESYCYWPIEKLNPLP